MFKYQPISPSDVELNRVQYRGTEVSKDVSYSLQNEENKIFLKT